MADSSTPLDQTSRPSVPFHNLRTFRDKDGHGYAVVAHAPDIHLVTDIWMGAYGPPKNFRAVLDFICETIRQHECRYWLADLRKLNQSLTGHEAWLAEDVTPRVVEAGLIREAVVLPDDPATPERFDAAGSGLEALNRITDGRIRGFKDIDQAWQWLLRDL
jgi:hypothetical protein